MKKGLLFTLVLIAMLCVSPCGYSATDVFAGTGVADYNSATGCDIRSNTAKTVCDIDINKGTNAVINWQHFNIPEAHKMNFNFANSNLYALNKVSTGVSRIAGELNSYGGGTVIVSSPIAFPKAIPPL